LLSRALGLRLQHVPYRGSPAALTDIMAGRINLFVDSVLTALPLIREGRVRALAVTTERRVDALPDTPSMAELGLPEVTVSSWQAVIGPARLPAPVVARLSAELNRAIRAPEMVAWTTSIGAQPVGGGGGCRASHGDAREGALGKGDPAAKHPPRLTAGCLPAPAAFAGLRPRARRLHQRSPALRTTC
jgi:hypothetical protein